jgi:hypothetical protein
MRRRLTPATAIASVALAFSLTGTGLAASRYLVTSTSQIKPSVLAGLHGARGPRGPIGGAGPTGPVGATGPAASANLTTVVGPSEVVTAARPSNFSIATCPTGTHAVSGGWASDNATSDTVTITSEEPNQADTEWIVFAVDRSPSTSASGFNFQAVAVCG